jgi:hypothetical protein
MPVSQSRYLSLMQHGFTTPQVFPPLSKTNRELKLLDSFPQGLFAG